MAIFSSHSGIPLRVFARLNPDGIPDAGFDTGIGFTGVRCIAAATDGSGDVYAARFFSSFNGTSRNRVLRLNADRSLDLDFDPGPGLDIGVTAVSIATDASGDIYLGGFFSNYGDVRVDHAAAMNPDGALD